MQPRLEYINLYILVTKINNLMQNITSIRYPQSVQLHATSAPRKSDESPIEIYIHDKCPLQIDYG